MGKVAEKLNVFQTLLPESVTLVAVSKTKPNEDIMEAYSAGHLDFGENKVQEMVAKAEELPGDIRWHMIGHLQRNKVKQVLPHVHLIHGVDSMRLLKEIQKQAAKLDLKAHVLLQMHIAKEETKYGLDEEELEAILETNPAEKFPNVVFRGMMAMATFTEDQDRIRKEFSYLKNLFEAKAVEFSKGQWNTLSMGMSNDFATAVEEGSTMVRIGSAIFGERNYS